jgi:methanethiol S-methyltransferase
MVLAWAGGAVFVASLLICAWWYFVALGAVLPYAGLRPLLVDAALVTVFASHHSLFARESVKRLLTVVPPSLIKSVYVWVASLLLVGVCLLWQPIGGEVYHVSGARAVAHAATQLAGLWLIARSVAGIDPLDLAGIRQAAGDQPSTTGLQTGGPYRLVRHPLYLGWMLMMFGAAHMTGDRLAFATMTSLYLVVAVPWEERALRAGFGEDYARYAGRVRWRIIPFVY